jgi:RNA polymerase sigma-70 factor (sigma-E family)
VFSTFSGQEICPSKWNLTDAVRVNRSDGCVTATGHKPMKRLGTSTREEFDRFVTDVTAGFLRTAYLMTWDLGEAENLVQETLLRTALRWPTIRGMDHPRAYVRRILINLAIDSSVERSSRAKAEIISSGDDDALARLVDREGEAQLLQIEARSEIFDLLAGLPLRQRAVIVLRYFDDLSEADIAAQLDWPIGTVKSTASRALEALQQKLYTQRLAGDPAVNE